LLSQSTSQKRAVLAALEAKLSKARQPKQGIGHDAGIPHREDTAAVKCEYNELK
jgi:hypothetical protein